MVIFAAALTAAVVALLVWGISTHDERTFQLACATPPSGIADYTGKCFEVRWVGLPITVSSNGDRSQQAALLDEIDAMNAALKMRALVPAKDGQVGQAHVYFNVAPWPAMPHAGATTTHYFAGTFAVRAEVRVVNVALEHSLHTVLFHELGHVLGLADDDYAGVAMSVPPGTRLSDHDVRALRDAYPDARY